MKTAISLEELQKIELDMLKDVADFCEARGIRYFLAGGTLLGAVRHHGFIPWDNDVDIAMPRKDYNRFMKEYGNERYSVLYIGNREDYYYPYAKVVDNHTILVERSRQNSIIEGMGIFIDIFPLDGMGDDLEQAKEILMTGLKKGYRIGNMRMGSADMSLKEKAGKAFWSMRFKKTGSKGAYEELDQWLLAHDFDKSKYIASTYGMRVYKEIIEESYFDSYIMMDFEGESFRVPVGYDQYLKQMYGDYMQLPPEDQRVANHDQEVFWKED